MSVIDLNAPPVSHNYTVLVKPDEERGEAAVRIFKDVVLFLVGIGFVGCVGWICLEAIISDTSCADEKRWAQSVISAATGGIIGYLVWK